MTETKAVSRKVVKVWYVTGMQVGIYDNCTQTIRLYEDRVCIKSPYVRWIGNTGGYAEAHYRVTDPKVIDQLKRLAQAEIDDDADYTYQARKIADIATGDYWY